MSANPHTSAMMWLTLLEDVPVAADDVGPPPLRSSIRHASSVGALAPQGITCSLVGPCRRHEPRPQPGAPHLAPGFAAPSNGKRCGKSPREGFGSTYKAPASLSPREPKYAGPRDAHGASLEADSGFQRNEFPWLWLRTCSPQHTCGINLCLMRRLLLASAQRFRCAEGLWISRCALPMMSTTFSLFVSPPAPSNRNAVFPSGISTTLSLC